MSIAETQPYFVIPLSVLKEGDSYIVGNADIGDFYQFPWQGVKILDWLGSGDTAATIKSRLALEDPEPVDVDDFLEQLTEIGFIHSASQREVVQERLQVSARGTRTTFSVNPKIAKAIFSPPVTVCYLAIVSYAFVAAIENPDLRVNVDALYVESNRLLLLAIVLALSLIHIVMHELGHMLAAARHGVRSKYGIGNRLWDLVAESDLTGILTLPKSQRYLPMLAGLLVDILWVSGLTILLGTLLRHDAGRFAIQVVQVLVLETLLGMAWQFNVFVKTDIYFVICNYFSYPDLDKDARIYLRNVVFRASLGRYGSEAPSRIFNHLTVLRIFSLIWLFGRILALGILFGVFLPTMWQYIASAIELLKGPPADVRSAVDTIVYVMICLTILGVGMYKWLKNRRSGKQHKREAP